MMYLPPDPASTGMRVRLGPEAEFEAEPAHDGTDTATAAAAATDAPGLQQGAVSAVVNYVYGMGSAYLAGDWR